MPGLLHMPYEVLLSIMEDFDFVDVANLALTCKDLKFLVVEERICKPITKARFSSEAKSAVLTGGGYARALRSIAKRREALATVSPFTVTTIGYCHTYIYCKGVLCYTLDNRIRILNLHGSGHDELVISIRQLLMVSGIQNYTKRTFEILYCSKEVVSCLSRSLNPDDQTLWLIVFGINGVDLLVEEFVSTHIFVRHNEKFLYVGIDSGVDTSSWVVQGYDLTTQKQFPQKVDLPDVVGSVVGTTVCFEIHGSYFYALSTRDIMDTMDYESYYCCFRFPLDSPSNELLEQTEMWRRRHEEGPIDERQTILRLDEDETTGKLMIIECRLEWLQGQRRQRTYYATEIIWLEDKSETSSISSRSQNGFEQTEPPQRLPENTHPDNGFLIHTIRVQSYQTLCATFLDLFDDTAGTQMLRLHACSRQPKPPLENTSGVLRAPSETLETALKELYREDISFWPKSLDTAESEELLRLLNPPMYSGDVQGIADERSMVYVTGSKDKPRQLIFVGFDATIRLRGVKRWGETGKYFEGSISIDRKGKRKDILERGADMQVSRGEILIDVQEETAMYRNMCLGYNFGRAPASDL
ncbi:uncharacterized protein BP5553_10488 [Venustampulla echinocandica]|uniref:F-box domain-containing protein n=1 Tax=Venustampulla echinocandica TaxID=2656787 RepID=A0A370T9G1_9HELO|nr:uncharacterized protein BP5553_10488 [Venustampulla echinocandica]RDL30210.1 hypothetical protein BP5553_10488 [Venustampulla echinocandica]